MVIIKRINNILFFLLSLLVIILLLDKLGIIGFILGLIMLLFEKDPLSYAYVIFNFFFANNIVFMISRKSKNVLKRGVQYVLVMFFTLLYMILNLMVLYFILY